MKFHSSANNGVVAVISEEHAKLYATVKNTGGDPIAAGCRVFTFCSQKRMDSGIAERMVFTGTHEDLGRLINAGDHEWSQNRTGWDGYVPFSNGDQYGYVVGDDKESRQLDEVRYVTTLHDVIEVFGANALNQS